MSLESLELVESISALIIHNFSIQTIFKLNQTNLLDYLNHIFCSIDPKIAINMSLVS
jgi:hypothetical protein